MKKKRILVFTSTFPRWKNDTIPPFVYELEKRLAKDFEIHILAPHFPGAKNTEIMDKLKIHRFHYFFEKFEKLAGSGGMLPTIRANKFYYLTVPFFLFFEIIAALKLVKKLKPDIIHAHWIIPQGLTAYINFMINKTPYVITSHGSDLHSLGLVFLKKIILNKAKKITVVSSYLKEEIKKIDPNLLAKTEIIPMGVDTKQFNPNKYNESIKKKYGITGKFLLFVGRLAPEKGVKYLIEAMPLVLKKLSDTKLLIIGGGPLEQELKDRVNKLNIESDVIFLGPIKHDHLPLYFATADIFVSPSIKEGFGLTFVEGLMSGCSVIGTNIGGIVDIIPKSNQVKPKNKLELAKKIIEELKKPKIKEIANTSFGWAFICKKYSYYLSG